MQSFTFNRHRDSHRLIFSLSHHRYHRIGIDGSYTGQLEGVNDKITSQLRYISNGDGGLQFRTTLILFSAANNALTNSRCEPSKDFISKEGDGINADMLMWKYKEERRKRKEKWRGSWVETWRTEWFAPSRFKLRHGYKNRLSVNPILCLFFASSSLFIFPSTLTPHYERRRRRRRKTDRDERTVRLLFSASCWALACHD
jgi:hypothetical protein